MNNENDLLLSIQQLIDKNRASIEGFFVDSKSAAREILSFLEANNIINKSNIVEMQASKAA